MRGGAGSSTHGENVDEARPGHPECAVVLKRREYVVEHLGSMQDDTDGEGPGDQGTRGPGWDTRAYVRLACDNRHLYTNGCVLGSELHEGSLGRPLQQEGMMYMIATCSYMCIRRGGFSSQCCRDQTTCERRDREEHVLALCVARWMHIWMHIWMLIASQGCGHREALTGPSTPPRCPKDSWRTHVQCQDRMRQPHETDCSGHKPQKRGH